MKKRKMSIQYFQKKNLKYMMLAFAFLMAGTTAACGKKTDTTENVAETYTDGLSDVDLSDVKVELGNYKGLIFSIEPVEAITDEDVENQIQAILQSYSEDDISKKQVIKDGDLVSIDVEAYIGDEQYGEKETDYYVTIGSGVFLDGDDTQLIGNKSGDSLTITKAYPSDYGLDTLAGKTVDYKIKINGIVTSEQTIPELTDAFVSSISDCKTVDEFRDYVKQELEANAQEQQKVEKEDMIWNQIVSQMTVVNFPEDVRTKKITEYKSYDEDSAALENMSLETYVETYYNISIEEYEQQVEDEVDREIDIELAKKTIAKQEKISEDEVNDYLVSVSIFNEADKTK